MGIRTYPDQPRIYCDMDGVIADFERCMIEQGKTAAEIKCKQGTYISLHPIPGAVEGIRALLRQGWPVFVLTKPPSENPYAPTEKVLWLHAHLPELGENIIITPDKGCIGTERDFLIDDHPEWANAISFPGMIVKYGALVPENHPTNPARVLLAGANWVDIVDFFAEVKTPSRPLE